MLQKLAEEQKELGIERKYVTLDYPDVRYLAKHDPALFLQRYTPPVLIDEIQHATELLPYIIMSVDNSKRKGDFWITGSQVFRLMKNVSENLGSLETLKVEIGTGSVVCMANDLLPVDEKNWYVPVWLI